MLLSRIHWNDPNYSPRGYHIEPRLGPAYRVYREHVAKLAAGDELTDAEERELDAAAMAIGADREDVEADADALNRTRELEAKAEAMDARKPEIFATYEQAGQRLQKAQAELVAARGALAMAEGKLHGVPEAKRSIAHHKAQHPHLYHRLPEGAE